MCFFLHIPHSSTVSKTFRLDLSIPLFRCACVCVCECVHFSSKSLAFLFFAYGISIFCNHCFCRRYTHASMITMLRGLHQIYLIQIVGRNSSAGFHITLKHRRTHTKRKAEHTEHFCIQAFCLSMFSPHNAALFFPFVHPETNGSEFSMDQELIWEEREKQNKMKIFPMVEMQGINIKSLYKQCTYAIAPVLCGVLAILRHV